MEPSWQNEEFFLVENREKGKNALKWISFTRNRIINCLALGHLEETAIQLVTACFIFRNIASFRIWEILSLLLEDGKVRHLNCSPTVESMLRWTRSCYQKLPGLSLWCSILYGSNSRNLQDFTKKINSLLNHDLAARTSVSYNINPRFSPLPLLSALKTSKGERAWDRGCVTCTQKKHQRRQAREQDRLQSWFKSFKKLSLLYLQWEVFAAGKNVQLKLWKGLASSQVFSCDRVIPESWE